MVDQGRVSREDSSETLNNRQSQPDLYSGIAQTNDKVDKQLFYQYINSSNTDLLQQNQSRLDFSSTAGYRTGGKQIPTV